jgi:Pyruvate/2-oxoacid:ferredoxin oxidoreductase gamma subunit
MQKNSDKGGGMAKTRAGSRKRWLVTGVVAVGALFSFVCFSGGCKKQESASEKAGREAREAYEKSKELLKEGYDKTKDITKEGLEKGSEAAKDFQKGWSEGAKK